MFGTGKAIPMAMVCAGGVDNADSGFFFFQNHNENENEMYNDDNEKIKWTCENSNKKETHTHYKMFLITPESWYKSDTINYYQVIKQSGLGIKSHIYTPRQSNDCECLLQTLTYL